ncbi:DUF4011 domain-containing protein, partial [Emcibacteraceae bacterium]|nr:DUF4011 domain-containing protein [Emcibacteraceae bacterium]
MVDKNAIFVKEKVEELRLKLLDLTNRNSLLNFRHNERALTHVRIIDELPNFLYGEFLDDKRLKFIALPELDNEPRDEKTKKFNIALRTGMLTDEEYLKNIDLLVDKDDNFEQLAAIERELKNRIREELNLPKVADLKPISNAEWARDNDLEPKYDMPEEKNIEKKLSRHSDENIQTLLKPNEMRHKLSGLRRYITSDINETGVNTFYAAFGFLERYESKNSERPILAPLVLLQLDEPIFTKALDGEQEVRIQRSGEEPQFNLPLAEKLKEFDISLPEFSAEDTPESYMKKVEKTIKNKKKWRVRRFITFGRFQFSRLVMYNDLNPDVWLNDNGIDNNPIIKNLIAGTKEVSTNTFSEDADIYDIDTDPQVEKLAPILIMEADSSQHSAVVDAMSGKNLVIKGPPGTGKSQTITNLIANFINDGKSVLFVAEKMAALNVVHSRLKSCGLGDYCLELHSTKAKLKNIKNSLASTIENRQSKRRPDNLKQKIEEIKDIKNNLREYSNALNKEFGSANKTIHNIFWGEQKRRSVIEKLPVSFKRIRIDDALSFSDQKLRSLCGELEALASYEKENRVYEVGQHPWNGVEASDSSGLKTSLIIQAFEECFSILKLVLTKIQKFGSEYNWISKYTLKQWHLAPENCKKILLFNEKIVDFDLLHRLRSEDILITSNNLITCLEKYDQQKQNINNHVIELDITKKTVDEMSSLCNEAMLFNLADKNSKEIFTIIEVFKAQFHKWEINSKLLNKIAVKIFGSSSEGLSMNSFSLLLKSLECLKMMDKNKLFLRCEEVIKEENKSIIGRATRDQSRLNECKHSIEKSININYYIEDLDLDEAIYQISTFSLLSYLKPNYYKARKTYRAMRRDTQKYINLDAANQLRALKSYREGKVKFESNIHYTQIAGSFFDGIETDFPALSTINDWAILVQTKFNGIDKYNDQIKLFLLQGSVADLEAVKQEANSIDAQEFLDILTENLDLTLPDFMQVMKASIKNRQSLYNFLNTHEVNPIFTYNKLLELINNPIKELLNIESLMKENGAVFKKKLGNIYAGINTNRKKLTETIKLNDVVESLELPQVLDDQIYTPKLFSFTKNLLNLLNKLLPKLDKVEEKVDLLKSLSQLNIQEYVGCETIQDISLIKMSQAVEVSLNNKSALNSRIKLQSFLNIPFSHPYFNLLKTIKDEGFDYQEAANIFEYLYYRTLSVKALKENHCLDNQMYLNLDKTSSNFKKLDGKIIELYCEELAYDLGQVELPEGNYSGRVSEYTEMGLIRHQALKDKARSIPIRRLLSRSGKALQKLKPCFLMSPLSVAQYIQPEGIKFDLLVIDEASQMRPEDALGAIARSKQIVVVGDPKQLPPTSFFSKIALVDENYDDEDKIDNESILDLALGRFRPTRDLRWHYRSRHESLIAFSNREFYNDKLIVFPSPEERNENFGIYYNFVGTTYSNSCNVGEAKAIVKAAQDFMRKFPDKSLGIATMNSQQRDLIYAEMEMMFLQDELARGYKQKWYKERGGLEPFFVKNLESVQGDERDSIFISTVYGPDKNGTVMKRFGPINGKHGHRRLNVLFTRAKYSTVLFTSLKPENIDVTESSSQGLKAFKGYLTYASVGILDTGKITDKEPDSDFEISVMEKLESIGCEVIPQVGVGGFFIDLGVKHIDYPYGFMMGIECDGAAYHSSKSARDRDRTRQEVLEGLGWEIYRIWSTDWFHDLDNEFNKLKNHIELTIKRKNTELLQRKKLQLDAVIAMKKELGQSSSKKHLDHLEGISEPQSTPKKYSSSIFSDLFSDINSDNNSDNIIELFDEVSFQYLGETVVHKMTIVPGFSDIELSKINKNSALGRCLLGSSVKDEIEVDLPNGVKELCVLKIVKNSRKSN